jgi:hypothetical protein
MSTIASEWDNENDNTWDDWNEDESEGVCLFCSLKADIEAVNDHMLSDHAFNLRAVKKELGWYLL